MKNFACVCGNTLYFENTVCVACDRTLGYLPDIASLSALEPMEDGRWRALHADAQDKIYRQCSNYQHEHVCNWMVEADDEQAFCVSCRLNEVIPNLDAPNHRSYWYNIEAAKRRLLYTLFGLGLPVIGQQENPAGLAFAFLADQADHEEFSDKADHGERILTGHADGLITINVAEADDIARTRMRTAMKEGYRTLLGHFRHEMGHYFWTMLVGRSGLHEEFRRVFGDERIEYSEALQAYYLNGPPEGWESSFISAYSAAHPWEDWAECWAHYMHMTDVLETTRDVGFTLHGKSLPSLLPDEDSLSMSYSDFFNLLFDWVELTHAMNALNRSLGLRDAYPFNLCQPVKDKLFFIHKQIVAAREHASP